MPPRSPKLAEPASFPTWDELVAEAHVETETYKLPLPDGEVVEIPCPSGAAFLDMSQAQAVGDAAAIFNNLFPVEDDKDEAGLLRRAKMRKLLKGADFPIVDLIAAKVMRHYYGLPLEPGKSRTS